MKTYSISFKYLALFIYFFCPIPKYNKMYMSDRHNGKLLVNSVVSFVDQKFSSWNWTTNDRNRLRTPTCSRQTSWLYTSAVEEFHQGLPGSNPAGGQSGTWIRDLQISSSKFGSISQYGYHSSKIKKRYWLHTPIEANLASGLWQKKSATSARNRQSEVL